SLIVARLYAEGVPVAGLDRLRLNAPLAVRDLLAAARFALQPDDDLTLASLLVSPLIGWSQEDLLAHAVPRRGSLWRHLREQALVNPLVSRALRSGPDAALFDFARPERLGAAVLQLTRILNAADFTTP